MPNVLPSKHLRIAVAACALLGATRASSTLAATVADDATEATRARAKELLQEGAAHMEARQYDRALESFDEAYRLVPSPKILFNLGIAYLSVARHADALEAFERFLKEAPDAPEASQQTARRHIDELRAKVATLEIKSDQPRGELILDGRSRGETTFDHALTIDAGPHELRARAGDATAEQRFTAQAGQPVVVTLTFASVAPTPLPTAVSPTAPMASLVSAPSAAAAPPVTQRPWFWVAMGAAVVVAASVIVVLATSRTDYPTAD